MVDSQLGFEHAASRFEANAFDRLAQHYFLVCEDGFTGKALTGTDHIDFIN